MADFDRFYVQIASNDKNEMAAWLGKDDGTDVTNIAEAKQFNKTYVLETESIKSGERKAWPCCYIDAKGKAEIRVSELSHDDSARMIAAMAEGTKHAAAEAPADEEKSFERIGTIFANLLMAAEKAQVIVQGVKAGLDDVGCEDIYNVTYSLEELNNAIAAAKSLVVDSTEEEKS
jgi:hypothetical protein